MNASSRLVATCLASASAAACVALSACASQTPLLAVDDRGHHVFGTVLRSYESGGADDARLRDRARSLCGRQDEGALRIVYGPPGETPPLVFDAEPSRNNFRGDRATYGIVACRGKAAEAPAEVPRVRVLHGYEAVSEDTPAVSPDEVKVIESNRRSWPPSAIEAIETTLKPPFKAEQIRVKMTPDYPTKADPDRLLGFFDVGVREGDDEARAVGAEHGANLLVKVKAQGVYLAFHVSRSYPSVDEAIATLDLPKGWTSERSASFSDPPQDSSLEIAGAVGKCYMIVGALAPDATLEKRAPSLRRSWDGALSVRYPDELQSRAVSRGRAFASMFGCPTRPSKLGLHVGWREAGGRGKHELFVYSRAATPKEMTDIKLAATQEVCSGCRTERASCLKAAGVSESACTTALRSGQPARVGGLILDGYR